MVFLSVCSVTGPWESWRRKVLRKPWSTSTKSICAASLCRDGAQGVEIADWLILAMSLKLLGPWFSFPENGDNGIKLRTS